MTNSGRRTKQHAKTDQIHLIFDKLSNEGQISFEWGGLKKLAQKIQSQLNDYSYKSIENEIRASYNELKNKGK